MPAFSIGIDLGTTNSALAFRETAEASPVAVAEIPQLVNANEVAAQPLLPSFLYMQGDAEFAPGATALPWDADSRALQARMQFVRSLEPHSQPRRELADWPASDDATLMATLEQWLAPYLAGTTRRDQLARLPLAEALRGRLGVAQLRALEALAPRELTVPSGSRVRIDYEDANAPCISVRLQEVFGLAATPRIADGEIGVTLKLLSPAQRPVQITRDLAGFWRSSYLEVRKDMRGRYPRHHWPDDPLQAPPSRGAKRRPEKAPRK